MVQTPVGIRCRECANLKRSPIYQVALSQYLVAIGVGVGLAIALGLAWTFLRCILPFLFINFFIAAGVGYAIGELISLSVNRKRGLGLMIIGSLCLILSYFVTCFAYSLWGWGVTFGFLDIIAIAIGIFVTISRLR
jgi:hypothetical protein